MRVLVKITPQIIEASKGCQGKIRCCLIARAVQEIFTNACVFGDRIYLNINKALPAIDLPQIAIKLVTDFDCNRKITPTSFEIDVPDEIIQQIGINSVYKILSESKTLECVEI